MSVQTDPRSTSAPRAYETYEDDRGRGWLAFAGASLSIFAIDILAIYGLVAYGARLDR